MSANSLGEQVRWVADHFAASNGKLPYGLLSLWDMINISVSKLTSVLALLRGYESEAKDAGLRASAGGKPWSFIDKDKRAELILIVELCESAFACFDASHIDAACTRITRSLKGAMQWSDCLGQLASLREIVEHELSRQYFYHYPPRKAIHVVQHRDRWEPVAEAFPDTLFEIAAAVDCFALEHNTASIFHSMRVAEHGLRALCKERQIRLPKNKPIEWETWQVLINQLELALKQFGKKPPGPAKDRALEFYSGAIADLNNFKDEYRNSVMHAETVRRASSAESDRVCICIHGSSVGKDR